MGKDSLNEPRWESEIAFWRGWLRKHGAKYESPRRLHPRITALVMHLSQVRIANVGAGPMSLIGETIDRISVEVIASDFLADEYTALRKELGLKAIVVVEKQDMAHLTYENDSFDVVFCANALDHSQCPQQAIMEMIRICKPKGWVYLKHLPHEGKWCGYTGLHQWNIDAMPNGDCEFWTRGRAQAFLLSSCGRFETSVVSRGRRGRIISVLQKGVV